MRAQTSAAPGTGAGPRHGRAAAAPAAGVDVRPASSPATGGAEVLPFGCAAVELAEDAAAGRVRRAVADLRDGRRVLVVGDGGGVVLCTAAAADAAAVTFMTRHARGLVQLALTPERCDRLGLTAMVRPGDDDRPATGMTRSIEARAGVTTGISSADRARTIAAATAPDARAGDVVSPGHMFPVRVDPDGVRGAARPAEAAVDLARLAGTTPAGVLCAVLDDDGEVATGDALTAFAARHALQAVTVGDVVARRAGPTPGLEVRRAEPVDVGEAAGTRMLRLRTLDDGAEHVAFVCGDPGDGAAVPTWIGVRDDVAGVPIGGADGPGVVRALRALRREGRGVVLVASRPGAARGGAADEVLPPGSARGASRRHLAVGTALLEALGARRVVPLLPDDPGVTALRGRGFVVGDGATRPA